MGLIDRLWFLHLEIFLFAKPLQYSLVSSLRHAIHDKMSGGLV